MDREGGERPVTGRRWKRAAPHFLGRKKIIYFATVFGYFATVFGCFATVIYGETMGVAR
jgi:hypothetical protein